MSTTAALPLAVLGDKRSLSEDARKKINKLSGARPSQFLWQLFLAWIVIFGSIWWAVKAENLYVSLFVIFIVATRQNVLGLLVHEQSHCLGFKARGGDLLVNFFCAYPLLVLTVEGYAQVHLSHHRYFFMNKKDPDIMRKSGKDWTFPMNAAQLSRLFLTDLLGLNLWQTIKGKKLESDYPLFKRPSKIPGWVQPAYYVAAAAIFTLTGTWDIFLLYWFLPLITLFQAMVRWGAVCEHKYIPGATVAQSSPIIVLSWWEKLVFPNLNFTLHPYHHYFPGVAFVNLPKVHKIFQDEGLINDQNVFYTNFAYLKFLINRQEEYSFAVSNPEKG